MLFLDKLTHTPVTLLMHGPLLESWHEPHENIGKAVAATVRAVDVVVMMGWPPSHGENPSAHASVPSMYPAQIFSST